jgi:hypothetical protein
MNLCAENGKKQELGLSVAAVAVDGRHRQVKDL